MQLTEQQVLALAPDSGSAGNGKKLAQTKNWPTLGRSARALWGECQGSGSKPHQVRVDLADFASKCSCPSFKFPCKHAIGLLVLTANQPDLVRENGEPEWVGDWLDKRGETAAKKEAKAAAKAEAPVDEAAQQKRAAKRNDRVSDGLVALQLWLEDQIRNGLARLPAEGPALFEQQAARLVDAQAAALAGRLRAMAELPGGPADWPQQLLGELGRLALTIRAFERIDTLPAELQYSLRATIGFSLKEEDVLATATPLRDEWQVIGQALEQDERVRVLRSWLQGRQSGQMALLLQFAVGTQPFAQRWLPGSSLAAELAFWPSAHPQRAMLKGNAEQATSPNAFTSRHTVTELLQHAAQAVASQPWLERVALVLADLTPVRHHERWYAAQPDGQALPLEAGDYWHWLAIGGGIPRDTAVEWNGRALRPLGCFDDGRYYPLGETAWTN